MGATFRVYVDESGDEGFSLGKGSSEWFVLSAVATRASEDLAAVRVVDAVRERLGRPARKPLHFRDLRHEHKLVYLEEIARTPFRAVSVLVHKPSLREPEKFRDRYRLYFYAARYLLERVSWCCRDHRTRRDTGDGSADVVFSNRSGMSYAELRAYLGLLESQTSILDVRVDWTVVKANQVTAYSSGRRMGLQVADAVASSFFYGVQANQYGFTEPRYAMMLKPVMYHRGSSYLGYGIKLWPSEITGLLTEKSALGWLKDAYGMGSAGLGS